MLSSVFKRSSKKLKLHTSLKNVDGDDDDNARGFTPRLKSSVAVAARQRILHEMVAKEHAAWAQVMHKQPAAESVDKSIQTREAKLKDEHAHRYEVRHLKPTHSLLTLRLVVHARAGVKETCYLIEVEDSTDLYTVQRKVRYILGIPAGTQALRSMRVLKLILKYDQGISRSIVQTIVMSISPALNVTVATTLITVIYAVMGMQLYGTLPQCEGNKINESQNFADIFHAMQFLYQIATGQDFITVVRELDEVHDAPAPFFYFFTFYILSIFVFLNLFVAVLLEKFESEFGVSEDDDDEEEVDGFSITKQELIRFRDIWERHTRRHARLEHKVANRSFFQK